MKPSLLVLVLALCSGNFSGTKSGMLPDSVRLAIKAESPHKKPELESDTLYASIGETNYQITTSGLLSWGNDPADSIHLNTHAATEEVYLDTISKKYLIVFYEESGTRLDQSHLESRKRLTFRLASTRLVGYYYC